MDKLEKQLHFLQMLFPDRIEECEQVFLQQKRVLRKALPILLLPKESAAELLLQYKEEKDTAQQLAILDKWLHCYCPNPTYLSILKQQKKGQPIKLDIPTVEKLKTQKLMPSKEEWQQIFAHSTTKDKTVLVHLLKNIGTFGTRLSPFWYQIDVYANHKEIEVVKAALQLLSKIPSGVQKSIMTFARHCQNEKLRITALSAMQSSYGLPSKIIISILQPIIEEYRRLAISQGAMNDLWQEFRLIKTIYKNNGIVLSIPNINLGRF